MNFKSKIIMKTRLLLLFFMLFSLFINAQTVNFGTPTATAITATSAQIGVSLTTNNVINVTYRLATGNEGNVSLASAQGNQAQYAGTVYNFNNLTGLTPNTVYYYRFCSINIQNNGYCSPITSSFTTLPLIPTISGISSTIVTPNITTINYSLNANNSGTTTSVVKYGLTSGNLTNQVIGFNATGSSSTTGNTTITGLLPNTTYYFKIESTNLAGTSSSSEGTFVTPSGISQQVITEYNFDNTYNNLNGNAPFASSAGTSFTTDRNGNPNSAININDVASNATITNLPYGRDSRTISLWMKTNVINASPYNSYVLKYGNPSYGNEFRLNSSQVIFKGDASVRTVSTTTVNGTWNHYVFSYDGITAKIYRNGVLVDSVDVVWNTQNNSNLFVLGMAYGFKGAIDDLKIYNYALNQADVTSLYNTNALSTTSFSKNNLEANIYPNPANDLLNIQMEKELKLATIYTVIGSQVLSSTEKQINVSSLSSGSYFVRIEAVDGAVTTQKIIIK